MERPGDADGLAVLNSHQMPPRLIAIPARVITISATTRVMSDECPVAVRSAYSVWRSTRKVHLRYHGSVAKFRRSGPHGSRRTEGLLTAWRRGLQVDDVALREQEFLVITARMCHVLSSLLPPSSEVAEWLDWVSEQAGLCAASSTPVLRRVG